MDFKISSLAQSYGLDKINKTTPAPKTTDTKGSSSDALEVSRSVVEYQHAQSAVKNSPDVREDVVAKYQGMIDDGSYSVSTSKLADKLLAI